MDDLAVALSVGCIAIGIVCVISGAVPLGCIGILSGVCGLLRY